MIKKAKDISNLIHNCDTENLVGIAKHIIGYEPDEDVIADGGESLIEECDFILENFISNSELVKLHKQIFEN